MKKTNLQVARESFACASDLRRMARHLGVIKLTEKAEFDYCDVIDAGVSAEGRVFFFINMGQGTAEQQHAIVDELSKIDQNIKELPIDKVSNYSANLDPIEVKRAIRRVIPNPKREPK